VEALSVLAYLDDYVHWEWECAQQRLLRTIALAPNDAEIANFAGDHFALRRDRKSKGPGYVNREVGQGC